MQTNINERIAKRLHDLRQRQNLSLDALAQKSGVSRSMISLIERGESSPTAVVLERLATGLGVMLASLFEDTDAAPSPVARRAQQAQWRDPETKYLRRNVSPPNFPSPIQLVEVELPAGAKVAYETAARTPEVHQQVWVLEGAIEIRLGDELHRLEAGDCLAMQLNQRIAYRNPTRKAARYCVVIVSK